jgi:hypothetical protein
MHPLRRRSSSLLVSDLWLWWCVPWGGSRGCWRKPTLVRGLMTVTLSGAAFLVKGIIRALLSSPSVVLTTCQRPARGAAAPYPVELGLCAHFH